MSVAIAVKRGDVLCADTWEKWPVACDSGGDTQRGGNGAVKAAMAASTEPDMVNKVMKLSTRNQMCQVEGLVYDGLLFVFALRRGVCGKVWRAVCAAKRAQSCLCSAHHLN